jgi:RNA polymerase II-associated factor 1
MAYHLLPILPSSWIYQIQGLPAINTTLLDSHLDWPENSLSISKQIPNLECPWTWWECPESLMEMRAVRVSLEDHTNFAKLIPAIQPDPHPQPPHPADRNLLRPLATLGKSAAMTSGVSFLRRTEYISSEQGKSRFESSTSKGLVKSTGKNRVRKPVAADRNDPINLLRGIAKGFDIAYPKDAYTGPDGEGGLRAAPIASVEKKDWETPRNPKNPSLKLLDAYPLLPDLAAFPDSGGYMTMKFTTNPLAAAPIYDRRLDVALLRPLEMRPEIEAEVAAAQAAYAEDPTKPPPGPPPYDYEYFLPMHAEAVPSINRKMDVTEPNRNNSELYAYDKVKNENLNAFRYERLRTYETAKVESESEDPYAETALALYDPSPVDDGLLPEKQKAAYYYPILQKSVIRPRRAQNMARIGMLGALKKEESMREDGEGRIDYADIVPRDPDADEVERREAHRAACDIVVGD